jgi:hypothetical protein
VGHTTAEAWISDLDTAAIAAGAGKPGSRRSHSHSDSGKRTVFNGEPPGARTIGLILDVVGSFVDASFCTLPPMSGRCSGECGLRPSILRPEPINHVV